MAEEHIARLHAPVGYNIGAETPQEIAISVLAEILQVKNNAPGGLMMKPSHPSGHQLVVIRGAGISPVVWRYVCIMRVLK